MALGFQDKKFEDAELLNVIGAVLSNTQKERSKRGIRHWLRRWKIILRRQTQKHPFASIGVLIGVIVVAFFLGAVPTSMAYNAEGSDRAIRTHSASSGGSAAPVNYASSPVGVSGPGQVGHVNLDRQDIASALMESVVTGDYVRRSDIATGRFLQNFDDQWFLLVDVDRTKFEVARRGPGWVQVIAPYHLPEIRWIHRTHLSGLDRSWITAVEAIVRMVEEDKIWKLEHIRVY